MKTLTREDLLDILHGCTVLGTGGGGEFDEGISLIDDALAKGKRFRMLAIEEAPIDALVCTPYMLGGLAELSPQGVAEYQRLPVIDKDPLLLAYERFQAYLGREFYGVVPCELGGSNTAAAFYVAAMNDHFIIDADPSGRAVPEIQHTTYYLNDLPVGPIVMANCFGECFVYENSHDDYRAETIARALSVVSNNDIAAIDHACNIGELKDALITGTLSLALKFGIATRQARDQSADVAQAIATVGCGAVVFQGVIHDGDWKTELGFTTGNIHIENSDGASYRVQFKNENLVGWLNNAVHFTIPDLICLIDLDTGYPITNPHFDKGMNVAVVVLPAHEPFVSEKGLATFGPRYAGVDSEYVSFDSTRNTG